MTTDFTNFLDEVFSDGTYGFSIGSSGALAEFPASSNMRVSSAKHGFTAQVPEGSLAIKSRPDLRWLALETPSAKTAQWNCELIAHVDKFPPCSSRRNRLTEIGRDQDSLQTKDDREVLFDLGLGLDNADFCIRTSDPALKKILRKYSGTEIVRQKHQVIDLLIEASPTRVVCNELGRIEVYQRINRRKTPRGPHTHLLPTLLSIKRENYRYLPSGRIPVFVVHPHTPFSSDQNGSLILDSDLYKKFEKILKRFGWPEYINSKNQTLERLMADQDPNNLIWPNSPLKRAGQKIALRQFLHL